MKNNLFKSFARYGLITLFVCMVVFPFRTAHAGNVDTTIVLYPTRAIVTIRSITPAPLCDFSIQLSSGVIQNSLAMVGGNRNIPSATYASISQSPIEALFTPSAPFTVGSTQYVRLYITSGDVNIMYPPYEQQPLAVVVQQDPNQVVNPTDNNNQTNTNTNTNNQNTNTTTNTNTDAPGMGNNGLVPCGNPGQQSCGFTHLLELFSNIINFIFILVAPIAACMFVYWGFRYIISADNAQLRASLKGYFKNLIIGIIIVLVAWLAVATLLRALGVPDAYVLLKL